jgi:hypothetical protein
LCIALVTKRPLLAGTEMTYNYQYFEDGLDSVMKMKRQRCLCGADTCSGTIGGKVVVSEKDIWMTKTMNLLSGNKKYPLETFSNHIMISKKIKLNTKEKLTIQELQDVILSAKNWIREKDALFRINTKRNTLFDISEILGLLDRVPIGTSIVYMILTFNDVCYLYTDIFSIYIDACAFKCIYIYVSIKPLTDSFLSMPLILRFESFDFYLYIFSFLNLIRHCC